MNNGMQRKDSARGTLGGAGGERRPGDAGNLPFQRDGI
jgi:hypothetical protein